MAKKKKKNNNASSAAPAEPAPLNIGEITQQGAEASKQNLDQLRGFYGQLAGDIGSNTYAQGAWAQAVKAAQRSDDIYNMAGGTRSYQAQRADDLYNLSGQTRQSAAQAADRVNTVGSRLLGLAGQVQTTDTPLESELRRQAQDELALGRSLSPEQMRDATQSARQAFAARGIVTGNAAAGAELLNRDRFATQRQNERRTFALGANQNIESTLANRRQLAGNVLGSAANVYRSSGDLRLGADAAAGDMLYRSAATRLAGDTAAAGMLESSGNMALNTSNALSAQNPYNIALGGLGSGAGMIQSGSNLAANTASFNTNMQSSLYNSYLNNQAALQAARMQAGAMNNAATMGMLGSAIQGGLQAGGMVGLGQFGLGRSLMG